MQNTAAGPLILPGRWQTEFVLTCQLLLPEVIRHRLLLIVITRLLPVR